MSTPETHEAVVARAVAALAAAYPHARVDASTVELYTAVLRGVAPEKIMLAVAANVSTAGEFMPSAGTLHDLATAEERAERAGPEPEDAWQQVLWAIQNIGQSGIPEWLHPRIAQAVKIFGPWIPFCQTAQVSERVSNRSQFVQAYARAGIKAEEQHSRERAAELVANDTTKLLR